MIITILNSDKFNFKIVSITIHSPDFNHVLFQVSYVDICDSVIIIFTIRVS